MKILAIETSCDETAVAILEASGGIENPHFKVLGNALLSQALKHREYGGVYPNLAKREHSKNLIPMLKEALKEAGLLKKEKRSNVIRDVEKILEREKELLEQFLELIPTIKKPGVDIIAVTQGPGLEPALWVGLNFARALSAVWNIPLVPVNHMEGHALSVLADGKEIEFPMIALLISGGHTELVLAKNWMRYEVIGETRDDASGEAFDKVARMLGLPYPGGPEISKAAAEHRRTHLEGGKNFKLPRPMIDSPDLDFSFSGLKTAVLYRVREVPELTDDMKKELAREFEDAVIDVLITKTKKALKKHEAKTLMIGGGVAANKELRKRFEEFMQNNFPHIDFLVPDIKLSTDNAIMIGVAGYLRYTQDKADYKVSSAREDDLAADGTLPLTSR